MSGAKICFWHFFVNLIKKSLTTRFGVCQSVCPVDNFYLEGGKAKRKQSTCEFCLACAHNCPQKAIGLSIADKNPNARYRNPHISLQEIIDANRNP